MTVKEVFLLFIIAIIDDKKYQNILELQTLDCLNLIANSFLFNVYDRKFSLDY